MSIRYYHEDRGNSDTTRDDTKFFRMNKYGRLVEISPALAGAHLYLGVEWETDDYDGYGEAEEASDYVDATFGRYCHCEHDGSLDCGFEIVTNPMTLAAHRAAHWEQMFDELQSSWNAQANDTRTCGMHVHVSRAALGNDPEARYKCIAKILELVERFESELSCVARRTIADCDWCAPTGYGHDLNDSARDMVRKAHRIQDEQGLGCHDQDRYHAVNLQNVNTIEFRIFKGTLDATAAYASLALVDGLVRWCKQHTSIETHAVTWNGLLDWISDETLTTYWGRRVPYLYRYTD